jgi:hypothetical protein
MANADLGGVLVKYYRVTALAFVEVSIEVEANSRVEATVKAESMRRELESAVSEGTIVNIELTGAKLSF